MTYYYTNKLGRRKFAQVVDADNGNAIISIFDEKTGEFLGCAEKPKDSIEEFINHYEIERIEE